MKTPIGAIFTAIWTLVCAGNAAALPSGSIYITRRLEGEVDRISPSGVVTPIATGLSFPLAITLDSAGNIYVSNTVGRRQQATITRITTGGAASVFAIGLTVPVDLAFSPSGELYASDEIEETIYKITPRGAVLPFVKIPDEPEGIGFDHSGNLYVAALHSPRVYKVTPAGQLSIFADLHGQPRMTGLNGLAIDQNDNVFVNNNIADIAEITPSGFVSLLSVQGSTHLGSMTFDPGGALLAADTGNNSIIEVTSPTTYRVAFTGLDHIHGIAVPEPGLAAAFLALLAISRRSRA